MTGLLLLLQTLSLILDGQPWVTLPGLLVLPSCLPAATWSVPLLWSLL